MSKSILVINTPENCFKCDLKDGYFCGITKRWIDEDCYEKPDWCPLRNFPEKKTCEVIGNIFDNPELLELEEYNERLGDGKMKADEAIGVLTDKNTTYGTLKCDDMAWRKLKPAIDMAMSALEKQLPKKPNKREIGRTIISKIYHCPNCNKRLYDCAFKNGKLDHVSHGSRKSKFCEDCGQKLDWRD